MPPTEESHQVEIRRIEPGDDAGLANLIRETLREFGVCGPGTSERDASIDGMCSAYSVPGSAYFVAIRNGRVVGGGGIAPLLGGATDTCELQKMYLAPELRGLGIGSEMLKRCLATAAELGYRHCYLETRSNMHAARKMYLRNGFQECSAPMGATGHFGCDAWYVRSLD